MFSSRGQSRGNPFTPPCLNWNKSGEPEAVRLQQTQPLAPLTQGTSVHEAEVRPKTDVAQKSRGGGSGRAAKPLPWVTTHPVPDGDRGLVRESLARVWGAGAALRGSKEELEEAQGNHPNQAG